jgi:hypothetical protein
MDFKRSIGALGIIMLAACSSEPESKPSGSSPDSATFSELNGTISGAVTGTVTKGKIVIYRSATTPPMHALTINASVQAGSLAFSSPQISTGVIASGISFTTTPAAGTFTNTDPQGIEGDVGMNLEQADDGAHQYSAHPAGAQGALLGTWKVILTSVTPSAPLTSEPDSFVYYVIHGSIDATMPGNHINKGLDSIPGTTSMHLEF